MSVKVSLVTVLVLVLCLCQGDALKCYECDSMTNPNCKDRLDTIQMTSCSWIKSVQTIGEIITKSTANYGQVACSKMEIQDNGQVHVIRSCHVPNSKDYDVCRPVKNFYLTCKSCFTDGCNGY